MVVDDRGRGVDCKQSQMKKDGRHPVERMIDASLILPIPILYFTLNHLSNHFDTVIFDLLESNITKFLSENYCIFVHSHLISILILLTIDCPLLNESA